jgi:hypothetical protein
VLPPIFTTIGGLDTLSSSESKSETICPYRN